MVLIARFQVECFTLAQEQPVTRWRWERVLHGACCREMDGAAAASYILREQRLVQEPHGAAIDLNRREMGAE